MLIDKNMEKNFKELDIVMPIVKRVHGPHHGEIFEVSDIYETIKEKISRGDDNLDDELKKLREITGNYKVPGDVCETYEKIYKVLEEFDRSYENR